MRPFVAIVVLTWNGRDETLRCLDSLRRLDYAPRQTILVDNGSTDGTEPAVRVAFPEVEIIQTGANLGFARGMNVGIARALAMGAVYILLLNNDTVVDPTMLHHLVAAMEADEQIGIAGPKTLYLRGENDRLFYAGAWARWLTLVPIVRGVGQIDTGQFDAPADVDFVWGHAMLIRRTVLERIGGFDPAFFMYYEDLDLCLRVRAAGYRLRYVPAARIWHCVEASTRGNAAIRWQLKAASAVHFYQKHHPPPLAALKWALTVVWILGRELRHGKLRSAMHLAIPYLAGLRRALSAPQRSNSES